MRKNHGPTTFNLLSLSVIHVNCVYLSSFICKKVSDLLCLPHGVVLGVQWGICKNNLLRLEITTAEVAFYFCSFQCYWLHVAKVNGFQEYLIPSSVFIYKKILLCIVFKLLSILFFLDFLLLLVIWHWSHSLCFIS